MEDKNLQKAFESWEVLSGTKEEVAAYQARVKKIYDEQSMIGEARMQGREEGVQNVAEKLIAGKIPLEDIVKYTGLSLEEVQSIQQRMG